MNRRFLHIDREVHVAGGLAAGGGEFLLYVVSEVDGELVGVFFGDGGRGFDFADCVFDCAFALIEIERMIYSDIDICGSYIILKFYFKSTACPGHGNFVDLIPEGVYIRVVEPERLLCTSIDADLVEQPLSCLS